MNNEDYTNHLQVLGVDHDSSWSDIKTAFQRAAREWHPDRHIEEPEKQKLAEERFKIISQAYNALSSYYQRHGRLPGDPAQAQEASPLAEEQGFEAPRQAGTSIWSRHASEEESMLWHIIVRRSAIVLLSIGTAIALLILLLSADGPFSNLAADRPYTAGKPLGGNGPGSRPLNLVRPDSPAVAVKPVQHHSKSLALGATFGETQDILGVPARVEGDIWFYGKSEIHFKDGFVADWIISDSDPLNVSLTRKRVSAPLKTYIIVGDTKAEILRIQGSPIWKTNSVWKYKISKIFFSGDKVTGWYSSPLDPLKIKKH